MTHNIAASFLETGIAQPGDIIDAEHARALHQQVRELRDLGAELFLPEAEFRLDPQFRGVNPIPGRNLADTLSQELRFIEHNQNLIDFLGNFLGSSYRIRDRKFVCGVPRHWMPAWVNAMVGETGVKNLGAYIRPDYRDMTYFSGIDFHQDIIDWPGQAPDFLTLYVYLDDVGVQDAPLHVLPGSHRLGATRFPHDLGRLPGDAWLYRDDAGRTLELRHRLLTGRPGEVNLWHPFILHGTQAVARTRPRISLRYLVEGPAGLLQQLNERIDGPMKLNATREDLDAAGRPLRQGNRIHDLDAPP